MSRATDWSAKRSTRRAIGFSSGARNFALIPRAPASTPARRSPAGRGPLAAGLAHGPVAFWEFVRLRAEFGRVRDTLCMSVVLSNNALETGLAPERVQSFAGIFFFKMPRWVALRSSAHKT